jgi:hypothetical protein
LYSDGIKSPNINVPGVGAMRNRIISGNSCRIIREYTLLVSWTTMTLPKSLGNYKSAVALALPVLVRSFFSSGASTNGG